jgi:hypothetical protein
MEINQPAGPPVKPTSVLLALPENPPSEFPTTSSHWTAEIPIFPVSIHELTFRAHALATMLTVEEILDEPESMQYDESTEDLQLDNPLSCSITDLVLDLLDLEHFENPYDVPLAPGYPLQSDLGDDINDSLSGAPPGELGSDMDNIQPPGQLLYDIMTDTHLDGSVCPAQQYSMSLDFLLVQIILVLVAVLNTFYHIGTHPCGLILWTLQALFVQLELIPSNTDMLITLATTLNHLDIIDHFHVFPICPTCHHLYHPNTLVDS